MKPNLCFLLCASFLLGAQLPVTAGPALFQSDFANEGLAAWGKTRTMSAEVTATGLDLTSSGFDAKLYRSIELPPGRYVMFGRGHGSLRIVVVSDWETPPKGILNLSGSNAFTDYRDFEIPEGSAQKSILAIWVSQKESKANLEWLRVESAPGVPTPRAALPSPAELEKERPSPALVRGFMTGSFDTVTAETLSEIKKWGASVIRLQVNPVKRAKTLKKPLWEAWPTILDELDQTVANAEAAGLKVIVDLHSPPLTEIMDKHQFDREELWRHPDLESSFVRAWSDIARKLKPRARTIWGYDLYNEPLDRSQLPWPPREWYPLAVKIVEAIRKIDSKVWIVYEPGPGGMSRGYQGLLPLPDKRVIYSIHDYSPARFTHQGIAHVGGFDNTDIAVTRGVGYPTVERDGILDREWRMRELAPAIEFQKKWHVPMYMGEFSVIRWAPREDALRWLQETVDICESLGWSWSYHAFREYSGWSLEHDETCPENSTAPVQRAKEETGRAKLIKQAFQKNEASLKASLLSMPVTGNSNR